MRPRPRREIVEEVIPGVYQIIDSLGNITIINEDKITLIDTGIPGGTGRIVDLLNKLGRSSRDIKLIVITHNHIDHIGGLVELKKLSRAKVAIHKDDIVDDNNQMPYPTVIKHPLGYPPFSRLRYIFHADPRAVDILLEGGEVLTPLGGLEVIHTPGHTPGSISLYSPANKLLFVGDMLNNRFNPFRLPSIFTTDRELMIDSLDRVARLDFDILCFGHGKALKRDASAKLRKLVDNLKQPV